MVSKWLHHTCHQTNVAWHKYDIVSKKHSFYWESSSKFVQIAIPAVLEQHHFTSVAETAVEALAARCAASAWRQKWGVLRSDVGIMLQGRVHLNRRYGPCCIHQEFSHTGSIRSRIFISLFAWSDFKSGKRLITNLSERKLNWLWNLSKDRPCLTFFNLRTPNFWMSMFMLRMSLLWLAKSAITALAFSKFTSVSRCKGNLPWSLG